MGCSNSKIIAKEEALQRAELEKAQAFRDIENIKIETLKGESIIIKGLTNSVLNSITHNECIDKIEITKQYERKIK